MIIINLTMQNIIEVNNEKIQEYCKLLDINKMYIFGSAVSDKFNNNSDIDFLISFKDSISIEDYTDNYFDLHYKLSDLFGRKIDLITENSLSNPYFIESINETKELIYES